MKVAPFIRTGKHPPPKTRCDASVGANYDHQAPTVIRCDKLATVELRGGGLPFETWVCEGCAEALLRRQEGETDHAR